METTERLEAGCDASSDEIMSTKPEVKKEPLDEEEKPDYMRNMIFSPKEPPKLRRSSINNDVRLGMVHLYPHDRLKKELEDRGMSTKGTRNDCADRLFFFLSGEPLPDSYKQPKKYKRRKVEPKVSVAETFHEVSQFAVYKPIASDITDFLSSPIDDEPDKENMNPPRIPSTMNTSPRILAARAYFDQALEKARLPDKDMPKLQAMIMPKPCPITFRKVNLQHPQARKLYPVADGKPEYCVVSHSEGLKRQRTIFPIRKRHVSTNLPPAPRLSVSTPTTSRAPQPVPPHRNLFKSWQPVEHPQHLSPMPVLQPRYRNSSDPADISIM